MRSSAPGRQCFGRAEPAAQSGDAEFGRVLLRGGSGDADGRVDGFADTVRPVFGELEEEDGVWRNHGVVSLRWMSPADGAGRSEGRDDGGAEVAHEIGKGSPKPLAPRTARRFGTGVFAGEGFEQGEEIAFGRCVVHGERHNAPAVPKRFSPLRG